MCLVLDTMLPILKTNEICNHIYWVLLRYVVLGVFLSSRWYFSPNKVLGILRYVILNYILRFQSTTLCPDGSSVGNILWLPMFYYL